MALRIPRVSLRVEAADENDLGEVHGEALGLGLMLLLALDMMLGGDQGSGVMPGLMRYVFCAAAALMLLCGALVDNRVHAVPLCGEARVLARFQTLGRAASTPSFQRVVLAA